MNEIELIKVYLLNCIDSGTQRGELFAMLANFCIMGLIDKKQYADLQKWAFLTLCE